MIYFRFKFVESISVNGFIECARARMSMKLPVCANHLVMLPFLVSRKRKLIKNAKGVFGLAFFQQKTSIRACHMFNIIRVKAVLIST